MHGQRVAVEVDAAVLRAGARGVVHVDVVAHGRGVDHAGAGEVVGPRAFDEARAEQHGAVLHVEALQRGHDLQQRLRGRAEQLQAERAVGVVGSTSVALVPSAAAVLGLSLTICCVPLTSTQRSSTSLLVLKPAPFSVMAWPALAEAWPATAGVPDSAVAVMPLRLTL